MTVLVQPLLSAISSFGIIFGICEFGQQLTIRFISFDEAISQSAWYSFPIEMQRIFLITIANTQQVAFFKSYGNIQCTRESFEMVRAHASNSSRTILFYSNWILPFFLHSFRQSTQDIHILCCSIKSMTRNHPTMNNHNINWNCSTFNSNKWINKCVKWTVENLSNF